MSRFAVLLDQDQRACPAAGRIEADLAQRARARPTRRDDAGICLWQTNGTEVGTSGPLSLVGDLALTDLPELRHALGAGPDTRSADLVLAAWLRWGDSAPHHLNGAFAFALWDRRSRRLTVVRDRFGIRPLAYALTPNGAVLASELSCVRAGLDAQPEIDPVWVAGFLSGHTPDIGATAWAGIRRLPPGHLMTIEPSGTPILRSWYRLQASAPSEVKDAAAELRAALTHATTQACAAGPTATTLSGGLDSSTLALMSVEECDRARPALSLRYQDPRMDEGNFIHDVLQAADGRLMPVTLAGETSDDDLFDLDALIDCHDQPVFAPGLDRNHRLYRAARELGCTAILDGHGGDEVIGGTVHDIMLLAKGRLWPQALRLAMQHARFTGTPVAEAVATLLAARGRRGFGRLGRGILGFLNSDTMVPGQWSSLIDRDLLRDTRLAERLRDLNAPDPRNRDLPASVALHAEAMAGPISAVAFDTLGAAARAEGIEVRYPFYDHRVAELCVWQPSAARIAHGRPRALIREATRGLLPESIRLRRDKANFIGGFWSALRRDPGGRFAALGADLGPLQGWVNPATLRADVERLKNSSEPEPQTAFRLWRALCLAAWLDRSATRDMTVPRTPLMFASV
ncbi:MAG: asparagine synthase-related protein [Paracoccus sp. (in: a-proteobacteria)]|uniref:asparagine synthetase B family protein n=1 Tax=Paracoccus sp. TaxID=267 RepID=UPI003241DADC